jgi:hypothetical protein
VLFSAIAQKRLILSFRFCGFSRFEKHKTEKALYLDTLRGCGAYAVYLDFFKGIIFLI